MLSIDEVKKMSKILGELMGDVGSTDLNGMGELVDEDGLPIIELTEPLLDAETSTLPEQTSIPDEPDLIPLISLPASERERRRIERDRILDLLEQEEGMQLTRNEEVARDHAHDVLQKHKGSAQSEMEQMKATREMQKKMGKALLRNMADAREKAEEQRNALLHDNAIKEWQKTVNPKKSVSFADLPPAEGDQSKDRLKIRAKEVRLDWGDVAPAKLRSSNRNIVVTKAQMNSHPMKLDVVERLPTARPELDEPIIHVRDSDDESSPPSPVSDDSDEGKVFQSDRENGLDSVSNEDGPEYELLSEDDDFDLDAARHHREIALAYDAKRKVIGEDAAKAMATHRHHEGGDEWNQPEVPLDATLTSSGPKSSVSRFKADRITSLHNVSSRYASTSLGPFVLPASGSLTLQHAIRIGRLENDKLFGGDAEESASEHEDENTKEILEHLTRGEIYNIGPTIETRESSSVSVVDPLLPFPCSTSGHGLSKSVGHSTTCRSSAPMESSVSTSKPKISRFKLNRIPGPRLTTRPVLPDSSPNTPTSSFGNSKSPSKHPATSAAGVDHRSPFISSPTNVEMSGIFALPSTQFPIVVDSPSVPPPRPESSSNSNATGDASTTHGIRTDRSPTIVATTIRESTGNNIGKASTENGKPKKISRFLAERT